ncbi:LOW QUALITY PROTEIN: putative cleavage and polyadenylation specificity factor subunit 4-like protein [Phoenicopterus ruber ruber]
MQELVAGVEKIRFDLEADVEQQRGAWPLPFPGMDNPGDTRELDGAPLCSTSRPCPWQIALWPYGQVGRFWPKMLILFRVHHSPGPLAACSCPFCTGEGLNTSRAARPWWCPGDRAPCTQRVLQTSSASRKAPASMLRAEELGDAGAGGSWAPAGLEGLHRAHPGCRGAATAGAGAQAGSNSVVPGPGGTPFGHVGGKKMVVCKHWLRGLCKKGDGCDFLHEYDVTKMPECYFYSKFGECSNKDCPFLHTDATASAVGCPWYDRGFCRHGPLCKYKHTRRVMCANYLVGFCPEGPKCKFMHLKAGLMTSRTDPSQGAGCPWGPARLDLAAGRESGCKDLPPMEPPLPVTGATQHLAAQLWDTSSCPPGPQSLPERGFCFKHGQKGHCASECEKTQLEILLEK